MASWACTPFTASTYITYQRLFIGMKITYLWEKALRQRAPLTGLSASSSWRCPSQTSQTWVCFDGVCSTVQYSVFLCVGVGGTWCHTRTVAQYSSVQMKCCKSITETYT